MKYQEIDMKYQVIVTNNNDEVIASTEFNMTLEQAERYANVRYTTEEA